MKEITNYLKKFDKWEIQLKSAITFKDTDDERLMYSKRDNIENMSNDKADDVIEENFELFHPRYKIDLETTMIGRDLIFHCVDLLCYKYCKINLNCVVSYADSSYWIKNRKQ